MAEADSAFLAPSPLAWRSGMMLRLTACLPAVVLAVSLILALPQPARSVTLDECLAAALEHNQDVVAAVERLRAARAAVTAAWSAWYPMLGASAGYARTDNPPQAFMMSLNQAQASLEKDFNKPDDTENLALSLGLQLELFDFGRSRLGAKMARGQADVAEFALQGLRNELLHQVTRGYYAVLQAAAFVAVQEESLATLRESLRVARERLDAGGAIQTDVLNLEVQVAQAGDELIRARNAARLARAALNTAIGVDMLADADQPEAPAGPGPMPQPIKDPAAVARRRPEYLAACRMAEVRQTGFRRARLEYTPTLSAFGSLDWNSEFSSDFENSYVFGVQARMTFFDGFRRNAAMRAAQAEARAAQAEKDKAERQLRLDVISAELKAAEAAERLETVGKSIKSAEEALRITRERYQSGAADIPELLTAQVGLTGTRMRNVIALYDYLCALSDLERAQGGLVRKYAPETLQGVSCHER